MANELANDRLLRALRRQSVDTTPIWIMRQAGRYLPEYRATRERAGSFLTLAQTPELACEVTLQPLDRFDLDAAILFSDILTIPDAMGLELELVPGEGPVFHQPLRDEAAIRKLAVPDMDGKLRYVTDAVRLIRRELAGRVPLIGFAGSPWTMACYMIEGRGSRDFARAKALCWDRPTLAHQLLDVLARSVTAYLAAQAEAGAQVLMIFDSWGGMLGPDLYREFSLRYLDRIVRSLAGHPSVREVPVIVFSKGANSHLEAIADTGCAGVGVDWTIDIGRVRERIGSRAAIQGNLDPSVLLADTDSVVREARAVIDAFGAHSGHVFNLGHGITPGVDPDKVAALVDAVHTAGRRIHASPHTPRLLHQIGTSSYNQAFRACNSTPMDKSFEPGPIESKWYDYWEQHGCFQPSGENEPYCILLPPPNVTGTLHMGHAFQQTVMDMLARYQRMRGKNTLWQVGTDHAGIATQKIVENRLAAEGSDKHALGREGFIERVWQWKAESGSTISRQMRRLGASADWSRERFTMDEGLSAAVRKVFIEWYRAGLIYRGNRLVNWDPVLGTAVSDLEVDNVERDGHMWSIRYPVTGSDESVVIATTRPETMLGDVAVAVHPDDTRYQHLIGKTVTLPLVGRELPVVADRHADPEVGTGCVKITPAHDFNDAEVGKRHQLETINILTLDARINDAAPEAYRGLDRYDARRKILEDLEAAGLLVDTRAHKLQVPVSQRSEAVIEPMLTDQWFVDLTSEAGREKISGPALEAVKSGRIKFVPENWTTTYTQWLENIQDWCISRQLWWGHRIPAWYDEEGHVFVGEDEADARAHAETGPVGQLTRDEDVLDTWFSSALWPFSTLGWPLEGPIRIEDHEVANWPVDRIFLPTSVLVTGFDIIFFWVARMVMATLYFTGEIPFHEVYINAIVRDAEGRKMSKSKGNTLDPLDLIDGIEREPLVEKSTRSLLLPQVREKVEKRVREEYPDGIHAIGTDALRFTFAALASYSRTINFDISRAEGYKAFCNKLWNAARFVLLHAGSREPEIGNRDTPPASVAERWILARLQATLEATQAHFASYRFDHLAQSLYEFVWNDYCDWFVELAKPALQGDDSEAADSTRHTLLAVLETILRALHPIIPFITEEIWQQVAPKLGIDGDSIMTQPWPTGEALVADTAALADIEWLQTVLTGLRRIRAEMNIAPGKPVALLFADGEAEDRRRAEQFADSLTFLGRLESQQWLAAGSKEPAAAVSVVGKLRVLIPLAGLIDLDAEKARLGREIERVKQEIRKCEGKLGNSRFVDNAPAAVVEKEQQRLTDWSVRLETLNEQRQRLA